MGAKEAPPRARLASEKRLARAEPGPRATPAEPVSAEDFLVLAIAATEPADRERHARRGLAIDDDALAPDTQFLLLRQLYLARAETERWRDALGIADQMARVGIFADLAHHDASRAHAALGEMPEAIERQRAAARLAPVARRSFHGFCLASLQHAEGDATGAIATLTRAERWARRDRPLLRAFAALVKLDAGIAAPGLDAIVADLGKSPSREGIGQYVLGMLAHVVGDERRAAVHLRTFLRRNASLDQAKLATLRHELHRARRALAEIASD